MTSQNSSGICAHANTTNSCKTKIKTPSTPLACRSKAGFTLIEMAIVFIISGLILAAFFSILNNKSELQGAQMNSKVDRILTAIAEHYRITGTYPCPADPTLEKDDADFGIADCSGLPTSGGVVQGAVPVRTLDMYVGCSNRDLLPAEERERLRRRMNTVKQLVNHAAGTGSGKYEVMVDQNDLALNAGDVPDNVSAQLPGCVGDDFMEDIFQSQFTYAVTEDSTDLGTIDHDAGRIEIIDDSGAAATRADVHFVLVSHGRDQKGAYLDNGNISGFSCDPGPQDYENCDGDSTFRIVPSAFFEDSGSARHYDDRVEFSLVGYLVENDMWRMSNSSNTMVLGPTASEEAPRGLVLGTPSATMVQENETTGKPYLSEKEKVRVIGLEDGQSVHAETIKGLTGEVSHIDGGDASLPDDQNFNLSNFVTGPEDLAVQRVTSSGTVNDLSYGSDYTVSGFSDGDGDGVDDDGQIVVTLNTPLSMLEDLIISRHSNVQAGRNICAGFNCGEVAGTTGDVETPEDVIGKYYCYSGSTAACCKDPPDPGC
jgi:competence protein ComGC